MKNGKYVKVQNYSQQDSLASLFPILVKERAERMCETSGRYCFDVFNTINQTSCYSRMSLQLILVSHYPCSKKYMTTWKAKVTKHSRRLKFRLSVSVPLITAHVYGFLPTPKAGDGDEGGGSLKRKRAKLNLRDWTRIVLGQNYPPAGMVEEMMGFPIGWTDSRDSGIQLSLISQKSFLE